MPVNILRQSFGGLGKLRPDIGCRTKRGHAMVLAIALACTMTANAQAADDVAAVAAMDQPASQPLSIVDVISVTSVNAALNDKRNDCWSELKTTRQFELDEYNASPWLKKHVKEVSGATLGVLSAAYFASHYLSSRIWILPIAVGGGALGWLVGPFGIALGVGGSILGHALAHNTPVTIAGGVLGTVIGMALWHFVIPPPKDPSPDSPTEIPVEHFVEAPRCAESTHVQMQLATSFRVSYRFEGAVRVADLPYDPGDHLTIDAEGQPAGLHR
jgi:hypothetical protein